MGFGTSEMRLLRKEDTSLYLYIKDVVLRDFTEKEEYIPLKLLPELCGQDSYVYEAQSEMIPPPTERGRGWVYFDPPEGGSPCQPYPTVSGLNGDGDQAYGTPEQSTTVKVYEMVTQVLCEVPTTSGVEVHWEDYMIDYVDGRIVSTRELTNPTVSYRWNYVSVVDEWAAVSAADPPVVVLDMYGTDKGGYQLGGGKQSKRKVDIHVFANDPAERNDIVETIYDGLYLRSCELLEFVTGSVLDYDGTFYGRSNSEENAIENGVDLDSEEYQNKLTYLFDRKTVEKVSNLQFEEVTSRHVNLPIVMSSGSDEIVLSDLNAYRSKVSFIMYTYDDRTTTREY